MGACFGRCLNTITDYFLHRSYMRHTNVFVDEDDPVEQTCTVPITLELVEGSGISGQHSNYKGFSDKNTFKISGLTDDSLQVLDASGLIMNQGCVSFTPTSSIDLEWEDEGMPTPTVIENNKLQNLDVSLSEPTVNNSHPSSLTVSPWSQLSTPNSLEWDPEEAVNEDFETDNLLTEIERLTNRALEETAEWVNSS